MGLSCGVVASYTCYMPATTLKVPSSTIYPFFYTFICVAMNVAVHPSSHSFPMEISAPDWRWVEICAVLDLLYKKGLRLSSSLWVE